MLSTLLLIVISTLLVSLISLVGVLTLVSRRRLLNYILFFLVAFAAGSMLGTAFLELLPESIHSLGANGLTYALIGILTFFVIERYIHWHHCHKEHTDVRPITYLNLIGDGIHNILDGMIIAVSYLTDFKLGIMSTLAIALHEIPQEFSDFGILIHGGLKIKKALTYNLISASLAILGAILTFAFATKIELISPILLGISGGGFIYLSLTDIIPELHKETKTSKIVFQSIALLLGLLIIFSLNLMLPHIDTEEQNLEVINNISESELNTESQYSSYSAYLL